MAKFYKSYNKATKSYTVTFKVLTKEQLKILRSLFSSLDSDGVVLMYQNGFTLPYLQVVGHIPLFSEFPNTLTIPNMQITDLFDSFNNKNFGSRNVLLDTKGHTLNSK